MATVMSPSELEKDFSKRFKEYKRGYRRYLAAKKLKCDCDRSTCANCLSVMRLEEELNGIRGHSV